MSVKEAVVGISVVPLVIYIILLYLLAWLFYPYAIIIQFISTHESLTPDDFKTLLREVAR